MRPRIKQEFRTLLEALDLPPGPLDLRTTVVERIAAYRGRPIILIGQHSNTGAPAASVFLGALEDTIFYDAATSVYHQDMGISHELFHLLRHDTLTPSDFIGPKQPPAAQTYNRCYSDNQPREREIEALASMLMIAVRQSARGLDGSTSSFAHYLEGRERR